jgi:hypothetical protein
MRITFAFVCTLILLAAISAAPARAQVGGNVASPPAKADCKFSDGKTVHVDYSSPRMKGRKIFGDLVPYGEPWRAGANEATTFVVDADVSVGGKTVPAGSYTLFALPTVDAWKLIISKQTGEWGIPYPGESFDFRAAQRVRCVWLGNPRRPLCRFPRRSRENYCCTRA